ncbi:MAG: hypothetical protein IT288_18295 [Bdellovibrionales bacterium]|nr:hypothetical protein [Bdellovibrionales bacterium]
MKIKLKSFRYHSSLATKWQSEHIHFSPTFTVFMGDNGTGKTPMLWGMAYALGYPLALAPDIASNVDAAELVLEKNGVDYRFSRRIQDNFSVTVSGASEPTIFESERVFSDFLFEFLGISIAKLSSTRATGNGTLPYVSNFLPLIWVSQSKGWTYIYQPLKGHNFIRDQQDEMIRLLLNVPAKHPFERKKQYEQRKLEFDALLKRIEVSRLSLDRHKSEIGSVAEKELATVEAEKRELRFLIDEARNRLKNEQAGTRELDVAISEKRSQLYQLESDHSVLLSKIAGLEKASVELDGEAEILESNEVAIDEFKKFCGAPNCKVFESSKKLYGKRLLYLRDQLKDIKSSNNSLKRQSELLQSHIESERAALKRLEESRNLAQQSQGTKDIIDLVESLGRQFSEKDDEYRKICAHQNYKNEFIDLINKKSAFENELKELKPTGRRDNSRLSDVVSKFKDNFELWLGILNTKNIASVAIDESFNAVVNGVKFSEDSFQDGSTRSRIVLAYFASLLQTSYQVNGNHPGFMFLDTPRQHELHLPDLEKYFSELRKLIKTHDTQIVIACKDKIFENETPDKVFEPKYRFGQELRYLGPASLEMQ